ncbi:MAG: SSI family serine proteinase inhibitor [Gaiellaceae bacterium]
MRHYRLGCNPATGTVPQPARACRVLARLAAPFAPVPPHTVCAQISLGPQEAVVTGLLRGRRIEAHLDLQGSCEIERWRRVSLVVPGFPA